MFTSTKTILKLFAATALISANSVLKNSNDLSKLVNTASEELQSGKKKINSVRDEFMVIMSMLKSWVKGDYHAVPWTTLALCAGALIYFVNPLDAVPDIVPGLGLLDDATVIGFVFASIKKDIQSYMRHTNKEVIGRQLVVIN